MIGNSANLKHTAAHGRYRAAALLRAADPVRAAAFGPALGDWPPRLISLRDVAQILAGGDVDLDDTLRTARRWQAQAVVARAVTHAWDALALSGSSPWVEWACAYVPSARDLVVPYISRIFGRLRRKSAGIAARKN